MPTTTPDIKINSVKYIGGEWVDIRIVGNTFDEAFFSMEKNMKEHGLTLVHPFDDLKIITGAATVGVEILEDYLEDIDYLFICVGGGGLSSGVSSYFKLMSPWTKIIGCEPKGSPSMYESI